MFELGIFGLILLAVAYWATLYFMGRHDDVLHGKFVHPDPMAPEPAAPRRPPVVPAPHADPQALQSLLDAIKRDLKDAAQI